MFRPNFGKQPCPNNNKSGDGQPELPLEGQTAGASNAEPKADKPKINKFKGVPCWPGQKLHHAFDYVQAGEGTYEDKENKVICASILGWSYAEFFPEKKIKVITVRREGRRAFVAPVPGSIVTCQVIRRNQYVAIVNISHVENQKLDYLIKAVIHRSAIMRKHTDLIKVETSYGLGDTLLARVLPHCYSDDGICLTTGEEGLGVVAAKSKAGHYMIPISWDKMKCTKTKKKVSRKVARIPENILEESEPEQNQDQNKVLNN